MRPNFFSLCCAIFALLVLAAILGGCATSQPAPAQMFTPADFQAGIKELVSEIQAANAASTAPVHYERTIMRSGDEYKSSSGMMPGAAPMNGKSRSNEAFSEVLKVDGDPRMLERDPALRHATPATPLQAAINRLQMTSPPQQPDPRLHGAPRPQYIVK